MRWEKLIHRRAEKYVSALQENDMSKEIAQLKADKAGVVIEDYDVMEETNHKDENGDFFEKSVYEEAR